MLVTPRATRASDADGPGEPRILAFATGCSYRRRLEAWLARSSVVAERVMEYSSYHAIVACVAAGGGIAVVPRSVLRASGMEAQLGVHALPAEDRQARTLLVWRRGHRRARSTRCAEELR